WHPCSERATPWGEDVGSAGNWKIANLLRMTGRILRRLLRGLGIVWALPNSLLGFSLGLAALATGGRAQLAGRAIEFHGGLAAWLLERAAPLEGGAMAI